jgi:Protein of unknown function (DUF3293)
MSRLTFEAQAAWEAIWQQTIWEYQVNAHWQQLPSHGSWFLLSAWNPASQRLPLAVNHARDAVLAAEIAARGLSAQRCRGRSPDSSWSEDAWMISDQFTPDFVALRDTLLNRYGQLAGVCVADGVLSWCWASSWASRWMVEG